MQEIQTPHIVRLGWFNGDLGESVKRYSSRFMKISASLSSLNKFIMYDEIPNPYLILISHDIGRKFTKGDYNLGLTIASDDSSYNERILSDFRSKTGIPELHEPRSPEVRNMLGTFADALPIFKNIGVENIDLAITQIFG